MIDMNPKKNNEAIIKKDLVFLEKINFFIVLDSYNCLPLANVP